MTIDVAISREHVGGTAGRSGIRRTISLPARSIASAAPEIQQLVFALGLHAGPAHAVVGKYLGPLKGCGNRLGKGTKQEPCIERMPYVDMGETVGSRSLWKPERKFDPWPDLVFDEKFVVDPDE